MNLIFWISVVAMTLIAWSFLIFPFYKKYPRVFFKIVLMIFPLLPLSSYFIFSHYSDLRQFFAWQEKRPEVHKLIAQLRMHLQQDPNSAEGWYLLGKLYLDDQQYENAKQALEKAHQLNSKNN